MRTAAVRVLFALATCVSVVACGSTVPVEQSVASGDRRPGAGRGSAVSEPDDGAVDDGSGPAGAQTGSGPRQGGPTPRAGGPGTVTAPGGGGPTTTLAAGEPIPVGFETNDGGDDASRQAGVTGSTSGNTSKQWRILIDQVNKSGGINGRTIKPVMFDYRSGGEHQEACATFTEDNKVVAVVSDFTIHPPSYVNCLSSRGVAFVSTANLDRATLDRNPGLFLPTQITLDRRIPAYFDALETAGFFGTGKRIGLLVRGDAAYQDARRTVFQRELDQRGLTLADEQVVDMSNTDTIARDSSTAAVRFSTARIDEVLLLVDFGLATGTFMLTAEAQGYRPRYGLSTRDAPQALRANGIPDAQFAGMAGIGWDPYGLDVDDGENPPLTPQAQACLDLMAAGGAPAQDPTNRWVLLTKCDVMAFFRALATQAGSDFSLASFEAAVSAVGDSFVPASTFAAAFPNGRREGVAAIRRTAFVDGRIRYVSGDVPVG